jgi:hypothetical protein
MQQGRARNQKGFRHSFGRAERVLRRGGRSRFAATPRRGRCDYFRSRRRHNGFPRSSEAELLCHRRTPRRIGRCGQRMIRRQFPVGAIRRRFEPMSVAEMPAQHQATKPAFEADDMVVLHRPPNRDCRCRRSRLRRALAEATERAMHDGNQSRKLINGDTVLCDITTDDLHNQARISLLRTAVIGHIFCPNVVDWGLCSRAWFVCVNLFGPSRDPLKPKDPRGGDFQSTYRAPEAAQSRRAAARRLLP